MTTNYHPIIDRMQAILELIDTMDPGTLPYPFIGYEHITIDTDYSGNANDFLNSYVRENTAPYHIKLVIIENTHSSENLAGIGALQYALPDGSHKADLAFRNSNNAVNIITNDFNYYSFLIGANSILHIYTFSLI